MPAPLIIFKSTTTHSGTGGISVTRPAVGIGKAGDLELLFVETANQAVATPSGFTIHPQSPVGVGTAAATTATRLSIFYRFNTGETGTIYVADSGDHQLATLVTLRGIDTVQPFEPITTYFNGTAGKSFSQTELNVTTDFASVLFAVVSDQIDSTSNQNVVATCTFSPALTPVWTSFYKRTTSSNGGGITYGTAQIDTPDVNAITEISITSTGSIIPCAIYFYVRGCRYGEAIIPPHRTYVSSAVVTTDSSQADIYIGGSSSATYTSGTGTISVPRYAGMKTGDVEFLIIEYPGGTLTVPPGWQDAPNSPCVCDNTTYPTTLSVLWRIANGDTASIPLTAPYDHIGACHAYVSNCDEVQPFFMNIPGSYKYAGLLAGYEIKDFKEVEAVPTVITLPNEHSSILAWAIAAHSVDSTSQQIGATFQLFNLDNWYFDSREYLLNTSLGTTQGNGGGITAASTVFKTKPDDADRGFRLQDLYVGGSTSSTRGVAALSLLLKAKVGGNHRYANVSVPAQFDLEINHNSVGGQPDICPTVFSRSPAIFTDSTGVVESPYLKYDGSTVTDISEYNGKLEFLFVWTYPGETATITSGGTWQLVSNGLLRTTDDYLYSAIDLRVYFRIHPNNVAANVTLSDPGERCGAMRLMIDGAYTPEPIYCTSHGKSNPSLGDAKNVIPYFGGNGYAEEWPYYADMIIPAPMTLILGIAVQYTEFGGFDGIDTTPGPMTSTDTWAPFGPTNQQIMTWKGTRFFPTNESGMLDPARLGRMQMPTMGNHSTYYEALGMWIAIPSVYIPPKRIGQAVIQHYGVVSVSVVGNNECPNIYAYGAEVEGTTSATFPPPTVRIIGEPITNPADRAGMFELLVVETIALTDTPIGWTRIENVYIDFTYVTRIYAFWRIHPADDDASVTLTGATDHIVGSRILFSNAEVSNPILTFCYGPISYYTQLTGGNGVYPGYMSTTEGKVAVFGIRSGSLGRDRALFQKTASGEDIVPFRKDWVFNPYWPNDGDPYMDGWGKAPSRDLESHALGTTIGNGGTLAYFLGKRIKNTVDLGNYDDEKHFRLEVPAAFQDDPDTTGQTFLIIGLRSGSVPKVAMQPAVIPSHSTYVNAIVERSIKHIREYIRFDLVITMPFTASRSKEGLRPATITLVSSITSTGARIPGFPAIISIGSSSSASASKKALVNSLSMFNGQAVPVTKKNINIYSPIIFDFIFSASFSRGEITTPVGSSGVAELLLTLSFLADGERGKEGFFDLIVGSSVEISVSKEANGSFHNQLISLLTILDKKGALLELSIPLLHSLSFIATKEGFSSGSIPLFWDITTTAGKAAAREFLLSLTTATSSSCRTVTVFEYGELISMDLRATIPALDETCTRREVVIDVRTDAVPMFERGVVDSYEARRLAVEDFIGVGPKILGIEIVCVREVFDESR